MTDPVVQITDILAHTLSVVAKLVDALYADIAELRDAHIELDHRNAATRAYAESLEARLIEKGLLLRLEGTMYVKLAAPVTSADGLRVYPAGATVAIAIHASSDVRVWHAEEPPVLAMFKEIVGSEILSRVGVAFKETP